MPRTGEVRLSPLSIGLSRRRGTIPPSRLAHSAGLVVLLVTTISGGGCLLTAEAIATDASIAVSADASIAVSADPSIAVSTNSSIAASTDLIGSSSLSRTASLNGSTPTTPNPADRGSDNDLADDDVRIQIDTDHDPNRTVSPQLDVERTDRTVEVTGPAFDYEFDRGADRLDLHVEVPEGEIEVAIANDTVSVSGPTFEVDHRPRSLEVDGAGIDVRSESSGRLDVETTRWSIERRNGSVDIDGPGLDYASGDGTATIEVRSGTKIVEIQREASGVTVTGPGFEIDQRPDELHVEYDDRPTPR